MQQTTQIQPSFTLKTREGGVASADERADEVVIGVGPAFDKHQHHTLIDMPHGAILKELIAGVEEEGLHARVVRILRTSDVSFMARDAANLSGSGIGIGIQSKGTTVIHQRDLLPLSNWSCSPGAAADAGDLPADWQKRRALCAQRVTFAGAGGERSDGAAEIYGQSRAISYQRDQACGAGRRARHPARRLSKGVTMSEKTMRVQDYPLATRCPEHILTPTGKPLTDITLEKVLSGEVGPQDVRISRQTLEYQAQIAEQMQRHAVARNFRRAAELIAIPDERILAIYNALRPFRSSQAELLAIADELEHTACDSECRLCPGVGGSVSAAA